MIDNETICRLWLDNIPCITKNDQQKLYNEFDSAEGIFEASLSELENILAEEKAKAIFSSGDKTKTVELYDKLSENNISILHPLHESYPEKLLSIYNPPQVLYINGKLKDSLYDYSHNIAIIGSRNPDSYGREYAAMFARTLAARGYNIISGLARGIDCYAHKGALEANGYTIGILGCGIDQVYPRENYMLYKNIKETGAIISEYRPGTVPAPYHFPERNRIISALSDGILVVEAKKKSGSLITVSLGLEQGKQIYVIPGRLCDSLSEGTNDLIHAGALCVTCPEQIIEEISGEFLPELNLHKENVFLTDEEKVIYNLLSLDETYIDAIICESHMSVPNVINTLSALREKGVIKETIRGYFIKSL